MNLEGHGSWGLSSSRSMVEHVGTRCSGHRSTCASSCLLLASCATGVPTVSVVVLTPKLDSLRLAKSEWTEWPSLAKVRHDDEVRQLASFTMSDTESTVGRMVQKAVNMCQKGVLSHYLG